MRCTEVSTQVGLMKAINILTELAPNDEAVVGHRDRQNVATGATFLSETREFVRNMQGLLYWNLVRSDLFKITPETPSKAQLEWPLHLLPRHCRLQLHFQVLNSCSVFVCPNNCTQSFTDMIHGLHAPRINNMTCLFFHSKQSLGKRTRSIEHTEAVTICTMRSYDTEDFHLRIYSNFIHGHVFRTVGGDCIKWLWFVPEYISIQWVAVSDGNENKPNKEKCI